MELNGKQSLPPAGPARQLGGLGSAPAAPGSTLKVRPLTLLWNRKWAILASLVLGLLAGLAWVVWQPPLFQSAAVIEIMGFNESFMGLNQVDPQAGTGNYSATAANLQTQARILTSGTMLARVAERLNLELTPITSTPTDVFSKLRNRLDLTPSEPVEMMRAAVTAAAKSASARSVGASRLMEIRCESTSPEVAANFANALANEYITQNLQLRTNTALRTMQWLEGQVEEVRARRQAAEERLKTFIQQSGLEFASDQAPLDTTRLAQLQLQLSSAQSDRLAKQSRYELAKESSPEALPDILDDGRLQALRGQLVQLRTERANLTATLTANHYKVQRVQGQIDEIEATLLQERGNLVRRIQNEYEAALQQEKLLSQAYSRQLRVVGGKSTQNAEYTSLKRELDLTRTLQDVLVQQLNQAAMISAVPSNNVRIVDPAVPAREPSAPQPVRDIPLGGVLGMGLAYGIVFLVERIRVHKRNQVVDSPGRSMELLQVPELGVIPSFGLASGPRRYLPWPNRKRAMQTGLLSDSKEPSEESPAEQVELLTWQQKPSFLAESFRLALASILGGRLGRPPRAILVTSAGPGEGKTTVASNLAIASAETGKRVLLIDADVRIRRLHKIFHCEGHPGFSDLLASGTIPTAGALRAFVHATEIPGLSLMPGGEKAAEAVAQYLFSDKAPAIFELLSRQFDLIYLDSPPALSFADARLLSRFCDAVVLVVRAGATSRETALALRQRFAADGIPVLGTVLNDWKPEPNKQYGGYYPAGYYAYQDSAKAKAAKAK